MNGETMTGKFTGSSTKMFLLVCQVQCVDGEIIAARPIPGYQAYQKNGEVYIVNSDHRRPGPQDTHVE
jgi:hypothetical protein